MTPRSASARSRRARSAVGAVAASGLLVACALAALDATKSPPLGAQAPNRLWVDDEAGCGGNAPCYGRIQDAVDAMAPGDEIHVRPGRYAESVVAIDRPVAVVGPGSGAAAVDPSIPDDPAIHALWRAAEGAHPMPALTVRAHAADLPGVLVDGFRFYSAPVAVDLVGRRPGDPLGRPVGAGPAVGAVDIVSATVRGNRFTGIGVGGAAGPGAPDRAAVRARWARGLRVVGNRFVGGADGVAIAGVGGRWSDNQWLAVGGAAIRGRMGAENFSVRGGRIDSPGDRGIDLRPLGVPGLPAGGTVLLDGVRITAPGDAGVHVEGLRGDVTVRGLVVTGAAGPGVRGVDLAAARVVQSRLVGNAVGLRIVEGAAAPVQPRWQVGGAPTATNVLSGNIGAAVELVVAPGRPARGPMADVPAEYNVWGVADGPGIEERIVDAADDPALGRVRWQPPIDAPITVLVAAEPAALPADGAATSAVTATVRDYADRPVPDGTLVTFGLTGGGALPRVGGLVEAEGTQVERGGEWGRFEGEAFGAPSAGAWMRSDEPGAWISWPFTATAALVRIGQAPGEFGRVRVRVDQEVDRILSATAPEAGWADHIVARDLAGGAHRMTVTLLEGRAAVDLLAAGVGTRGGAAHATLRADERVGQGRVTADAWGALGPVGGAAEIAFVPGPPAAVTMTAAAGTVPVGGVRTSIRLVVRDRLGRPVRDGTPIVLTTSLGIVEPTVLATRFGGATAVLTSGTVTGDALLRAVAGNGPGAAETTLVLPFVAGPPARVELATTKGTLVANGRDETGLEATVRDAWGHRVQDGVAVAFASTLGTLSVAEGATLDGVAGARLRGGSIAGVARIEAHVRTVPEGGPLPDARATISVALRAPDLHITKSVEPESVVVPGELVTWTLHYANRGPGAVYGVVLDDVLPAGLISPTLSTEGPPLVARPGPPYAFTVSRLAQGETGVVRVRARVDTSLRWGSRNPVTATARIGSPTAAEAAPADNVASAGIVVVPAAVYTVTLAAPSALGVGGQAGSLVIRVFDRFGNPAGDGTPVALSAVGGTVHPELLTTRGGRAEATFTSGSVAGEGVVRALSLEDRGDVARIRLVPGPALTMTLAAGRDELAVGGDRTVLTATLSDRFANPVDNAVVEFSTDRGLVGIDRGRTGTQGWISTTLRSGVRSGAARIQAHSGPLSEAVTVTLVPGPPARLTLGLDRAIARTGVALRVLARLGDEFDNGIAGVPVEFRSSRGLLLDLRVDTGTDGIARGRVRFDTPGEAVIRAEAAGLDRRIIVRVEPPWIALPWAGKRP